MKLFSRIFAFMLGISFMLVGGVFGEETEGGLIIASSLPTPPPGYTIERVIGAVYSYDSTSSGTGFFLGRDVNKLVNKTNKAFEELVKKIGGNAILNEHVDIRQIISPNQMHIYVTIQGEAVVLKAIGN